MWEAVCSGDPAEPGAGRGFSRRRCAASAGQNPRCHQHRLEPRCHLQGGLHTAAARLLLPLRLRRTWAGLGGKPEAAVSTEVWTDQNGGSQYPQPIRNWGGRRREGPRAPRPGRGGAGGSARAQSPLHREQPPPPGQSCSHLISGPEDKPPAVSQTSASPNLNAGAQSEVESVLEAGRLVPPRGQMLSSKWRKGRKFDFRSRQGGQKKVSGMSP